MLEDWGPLLAFEQTQLQYASPPPLDSSGLVQRLGRLPILYSAPHACRHWRGGAWKKQDAYTGAMAEWLHRLTGGHALYINHQINPDPHDDGEDNPYKQALRALAQEHPLRLIVDLHGVRGSRDFIAALGTMNGRTCPAYEAEIIACFEAAGFLRGHPDPLERLAVNHPRFTGGLRHPTVTRFAWEALGIPAIQIEINSWARVLEDDEPEGKAVPFRCDRAKFGRMMGALAALCEVVAAKED